jgi:hypothetical protein
VLGLTALALKPPASKFQVLRLEDVVDREHGDDRFAQPWKSFDPVVAGQVIGLRHDGREVKAPADGFVVFSNPGGAAWQRVALLCAEERSNDWLILAQEDWARAQFQPGIVALPGALGSRKRVINIRWAAGSFPQGRGKLAALSFTQNTPRRSLSVS